MCSQKSSNTIGVHALKSNLTLVSATNNGQDLDAKEAAVTNGDESENEEGSMEDENPEKDEDPGDMSEDESEMSNEDDDDKDDKNDQSNAF